MRRRWMQQGRGGGGVLKKSWQVGTCCIKAIPSTFSSGQPLGRWPQLVATDPTLPCHLLQCCQFAVVPSGIVLRGGGRG
ncbi:hypothetical protein E2C01_074676 [Portunus trituberculatus]|uniref:Uncharacterized protein n=1 Tax=Portunus trituberculatus TaxID=210409 RepID=A0A5B7IE45_PORTR|nr:hypothetical protein [Portunus trituberculatus]